MKYVTEKARAVYAAGQAKRDAGILAATQEQSQQTCVECGRVFDLFDETDAAEWFYGHDCEDV